MTSCAGRRPGPARDPGTTELFRRSLEQMVAREPSRKPWMAYGGLHEGAVDDSESIDKVVYDRETP